MKGTSTFFDHFSIELEKVLCYCSGYRDIEQNVFGVHQCDRMRGGQAESDLSSNCECTQLLQRARDIVDL